MRTELAIPIDGMMYLLRRCVTPAPFNVVDGKLAEIIGDAHVFIDQVAERLIAAGFIIDEDGESKRLYEMDHICYRCETQEEYSIVVGKLKVRYRYPYSLFVPESVVDSFVKNLFPLYFSCQAHGNEILVESLIGGRLIAMFKLRQPIFHAGFKVVNAARII